MRGGAVTAPDPSPVQPREVLTEFEREQLDAVVHSTDCDFDDVARAVEVLMDIRVARVLREVAADCPTGTEEGS